MENFNIITYSDRDLIGKAIDTFLKIKISEIPFDELRHKESSEYTLIKSTHTRSVVRFTRKIQNEEVTIYAKRCKARNWFKIFTSLFHKTKSRREWEIGYELLKRNISTALPLIYAEKRIGPFAKENYLLLKGIDNSKDVKYTLIDIKSYQQKKQFTKLLAAYFKKIHNAGFYHDDCSSEHILVTDGNQFHLIDLDNCKIYEEVPFVKRAKNIFQLFRSINKKIFSNSLRLLFLKEYLSQEADKGLLRKYMMRIEKYSLSKDKKKLW